MSVNLNYGRLLVRGWPRWRSTADGWTAASVSLKLVSMSKGDQQGGSTDAATAAPRFFVPDNPPMTSPFDHHLTVTVPVIAEWIEQW